MENNESLISVASLIAVIRKEIEEAGLFSPRAKGESQSAYKERLEKDKALLEEIIDKYYRKYLGILGSQEL